MPCGWGSKQDLASCCRQRDAYVKSGHLADVLKGLTLDSDPQPKQVGGKKGTDSGDDLLDLMDSMM